MKVHCAHTKLVAISKLKPNPDNPNTHPESQLRLLGKIIKTQGWRAPITVSNLSGLIVKGHGRLYAAQLEGLKRAPVDYQDYDTAEDERADMLADNRIAELAVIDLETLEMNKELLDSAGFDLELAGFEEEEATTTEAQGDDAVDAVDILRGATLQDLAPTEEERAIFAERTILVEYSGGKDSSAVAAWAKHFFPDNNIQLCYCDMGADFDDLIPYLRDSAQRLDVDLVMLRSKRNMIDYILEKGKWPGFIHPYCHDILHDTLDEYFEAKSHDDVIIIRGGRKQEKASKSKANTTRFLSIKRLASYTFFQPLYFADKGTGERILEESNLPIWAGYDRGLKRTACNICPGQRPQGYAAMKREYPEAWRMLLEMERRLGPGAWNRVWAGDGVIPTFEQMAERGNEMDATER